MISGSTVELAFTSACAGLAVFLDETEDGSHQLDACFRVLPTIRPAHVARSMTGDRRHRAAHSFGAWNRVILARMAASENPSIFPLPNGPYVFKDPTTVSPCGILADSERKPIENQPYVALCRCGGSKTKPFCDGSHLTNGFRSEKSADRTPDKRDDYAGRQIVIHDNRGICAHSGECTSRLATVFRDDDEPWIDADGAQSRQIIATIQKCPSGALSYSVENVEHADQDRPPNLVVSKNGPYCIEGGIELIGSEFADGASREHYCLCRCGASKNKPFCDGSHWDVNFDDSTSKAT